MKITWEQLATALVLASKTRIMTREQRAAYFTVVHELREPPLAGRRCNGCDGPLLQRPIGNEGAVTFDYDCTCRGHQPLDKSLPWEPVPIKDYEDGPCPGIEIP